MGGLGKKWSKEEHRERGQHTLTRGQEVQFSKGAKRWRAVANEAEE